MNKQYQRVLVTTPHPLLRLVCLGLVTFIFTLFSLELTRFGMMLAPLWFPTSIMMVAFYRHAGKMWPGIALACSFGNVLASWMLFSWESISLVYTVVNVIEACVGALLLRRLLPWYNPLQNLNDWVRLAIGSALIPPLIGGMLIHFLVPGAEPLRNFLVWVLSESIGALAIVPLGLLFKPHYLLRHRNPRLLLETLMTMAVTLVLSWAEDLNTDLEQLDQLVNGDINTYSLEKRYYTRDGEVVWALLAVSVVRHADGTPLYFIAQIEDINDLKHTEWVNKRLMERITLANEAGGIGIWEWDLEPDVISWDKRMFELYDIPAHIKPTWQLWHEAMLPEDREHAEQVLRDSLMARLPFKLEFRIRVKEGVRHIRSLANRVLNKQGEVERLLGINMDMTEVKQLNEALFQEKERLHITLDSIGEAVLCTDVDMNVTFMNPVAEKMSGWLQTEAIGQPILKVLHITFGEKGPLMENIHSGDMSRTDIEQDVVLNCRTGGYFDIHYSITPLSTLDGQNIGSVLVIQDVTESRKMLRQLSYSASHDALTHLANRVSFENHLKRLLQTVQETRQRHALVFIDLDRFKAVNDSAGHAAGDALLRELSSLMLTMLRSSDVLARLGGDEFGLLLPDCNIESARYIAGRLIHAINDYHFMWEGRLHRIGASAGITLIDENNVQASEIMSQADIACYASKNSGRGVVTVYEPQQERIHSTRSMMSLDEQWHMIKDNHLMMIARSVASPRIPESCNFWLISLRLWTSQGEVQEEHAFRSGLAEPELLHALDRRIFSEFFRTYAAQVASKGMGVALPLSEAGLASVTLVAELLELLEKGTLPGRLLHLVINVDVVRNPDENVQQGLQKLRHAGCRVVLSQVGRDMNVFNHLSANVADYLMLDAEVVTNVHGNLMDEMMVTIIQGHAQRLGMQTIAGPSNQPMMMDTLSGIGIDFIYGDTIGEPQPLELLLNTSYFAIN
ncbi:diguanylate cyclase [Enterobacter wuhouensis]|uniref:diguanylate cyclase n=1 Tax=Enterobacter wuhouensis TaxID=2529381 RepID=UPI0035260B20